MRSNEELKESLELPMEWEASHRVFFARLQRSFVPKISLADSDARRRSRSALSPKLSPLKLSPLVSPLGNITDSPQSARTRSSSSKKGFTPHLRRKKRMSQGITLGSSGSESDYFQPSFASLYRSVESLSSEGLTSLSSSPAMTRNQRGAQQLDEIEVSEGTGRKKDASAPESGSHRRLQSPDAVNPVVLPIDSPPLSRHGDLSIDTARFDIRPTISDRPKVRRRSLSSKLP